MNPQTLDYEHETLSTELLELVENYAFLIEQYSNGMQGVVIVVYIAIYNGSACTSFLFVHALVQLTALAQAVALG